MEQQQLLEQLAAARNVIARQRALLERIKASVYATSDPDLDRGITEVLSLSEGHVVDIVREATELGNLCAKLYPLLALGATLVGDLKVHIESADGL